MKRTQLAAVWIVLQLLFFVAWSAYEGSRLQEGEGHSILVRTVPVDPRDLLRGQFIQLAYDFSRPTGGERFEDGTELWARLRQDPEGFHVLVDFAQEPASELAPSELLLRGRVDGWRHEFGVEKYFVPEGTPTPDPVELTVRLRVGDDARARIESVYLNGAPWP